MAYNKKAHLLANTDAIRIAFALDSEKRRATEAERTVLQQYSGFGGIKCILNPTEKESDKAYWTHTDVLLFPLVEELHQTIRDNLKDERQYKAYFSSLKNSVLTAFYTPPEIVRALSDALKNNGIAPVRFLEPSAGSGAFVDAFRASFPNMETTCFEKDLLTGKILSHLHPDDRVHIRGFEDIEDRPDNRFDMVSSNIPFGDTAVFDMPFYKSDDPVKRQVTRAVHNYFFLKGVDTLREGGLLAFITSQGVMNSPGNEPVREWLMKHTGLVSAVRLPNNLMSDNAGTEVGSDLIILQKNSSKTSLMPREEAFLKSRTLSSGANINNYFRDFSRVVHTGGFPDKDLYGKPGMTFLHEGGVAGMAADLGRMLSADFGSNLNKKLYENNLIQSRRTVQPAMQVAKPEEEKRYPDDLDHFWQAVEDRRFPEERAKGVETVAQVPEVEPEMRRQPTLTSQPPANMVQERKSTAWLDWEEHSPSFNDLFSEEDFTDTKINVNKKEAPTPEAMAQPKLNVEQQPLMSLYDLFGIPERERTQINTKRKSKKNNLTPRPQQPTLFQQTPKRAQTQVQAQPLNRAAPSAADKDIPSDAAFLTHYGSIRKKYPNALILLREGDRYRAYGEDAVRMAQILGLTLAKINGTEQATFPAGVLDTNLPLLVKAGQRVAIADAPETLKVEKKITTGVSNTTPAYPVSDARREELDRQQLELQEPRPYSGYLQEHHRQGSLVAEQNGQIEFLQERYRTNRNLF